MARLLRGVAVAAMLAALCLGLATAPVETASAPYRIVSATAIENTAPQSDPRAYWTAERMAKAQPMRLPEIDIKALRRAADADSDPDLAGTGGEPALPEGTMRPEPLKLYDAARQRSQFGFIEPQDRGIMNRDFTSGRVNIDGLRNAGWPRLDLNYPYITVGQLFFTDGYYDYVCTASVISKRIVVTAGHCVNSGSGQWYSGFLFVPTQFYGYAQLGVWNWSYIVTTMPWVTGKGRVPNKADFAFIETIDQGNRISYYTGHLGWIMGRNHPNHVTSLGYPCNFDNCDEMHIVHGQTWKKMIPNNFVWGSDMRGGSSGGPIVQNWGEWSPGQGGLWSEQLRILGVTSWGYVGTDYKVQGGSRPNVDWLNAFEMVCEHYSGNCS